MSSISIESLPPPPQFLSAAPPGQPPGASAFHAALDEEMARTATAEGQAKQSEEAAQRGNGQTRPAVPPKHHAAATEATEARLTALGAQGAIGTLVAAAAAAAAAVPGKGAAGAGTASRASSSSSSEPLAADRARAIEAGRFAAGTTPASGRPVGGATGVESTHGQSDVQGAGEAGQAAQSIDEAPQARALRPRLQSLEPTAGPGEGRALPPRELSGEGLHAGEAAGGPQVGPGVPAEGSAQTPRLVRLDTGSDGSERQAPATAPSASGETGVDLNDLAGSGTVKGANRGGIANGASATRVAAGGASGAQGAGPGSGSAEGGLGAGAANLQTVLSGAAASSGPGDGVVSGATGISTAGAGTGGQATADAAAARHDATTQTAGRHGTHGDGHGSQDGTGSRSAVAAGSTHAADTEAAGVAQPADGGEGSAAPVAATAQGEIPGDGPLGATLASAEGVDLQDMIETIHATVELAVRQNASQARIALEPAELGDIRIHLSQSSEGLIARVTAGSEAATQALLAGRAELHHALSSLGTSLLRLDIGSSGYAAGEQERRAQDAPGSGRAGREATEEVESVEGAEAASPQGPEQALGELIDVLA